MPDRRIIAAQNVPTIGILPVEALRARRPDEWRKQAIDEAGLRHALARAIGRRAGLTSDATTCYRLLNGAADGEPGVTVDRFEAALVANLYAEAPDEEAVVAALAERFPSASIYVKRRPSSPARLSADAVAALAPAHPAKGVPLDEVLVRENGRRYLVRPGAGLSVGLFLDMREARSRLNGLSAGRTVLNLFSYTCAFGVAAMLGGADRVLNLDASRPALRWGAENYAANDLPVDPHDFVFGDAFDWLGRLARRGQRFDVVVADPPSFSTVKGRRFSASHDYARLAAACARVTAPGGLLLCCANEAALPRHVFRAMCLRGARDAGRIAVVDAYDHAPAIDFPRLRGHDGYLKLLWLLLK